MINKRKLISLDEESLKHSCYALAKRDDNLKFILETYGVPPLWQREEGFATLIHIILEQQVSLASALATYTRLKEAIFPVTPESFLTLDDTALRAIGFSRQKTLYSRILAHAVIERQVDFKAFAKMNDEEIRSSLKKFKGIGDWTVDIYLLMALLRPDAWPASDLGLIVAIQRIKQLSARPTLSEMQLISEKWRPLRAVAARLLWHYYLSIRLPKTLL